MPKKTRRILMVFDVLATQPAESDFRSLLRHPDWKDEKDVYNSLKRLGHTVDVFGVFDSVEPLIQKIRNFGPDVIFYLCESFNDKRGVASHLVGLFELLGVPYTGSSPKALAMCSDKALSKKILSHHGIMVPRFLVSEQSNPVRGLTDLEFPLIIKPLNLEASEGLTRKSLTTTVGQALAQVRHIHDTYAADVIIEEYIDGRELYVGIMGHEKLTVFPPQELFFKKGKGIQFLTYKAKWDKTFRKKRGITSHASRPLSPLLSKRLEKTCKAIYRLLSLTGYARFDLRVNDREEIYFIEANPNPAIARDDDFAQAAVRSGLTYDDLIGRIVDLAILAHQKRRRQAS